MKTIGAEVKEEKFKERESVRSDLALNRIDYVKRALDMFNHIHFHRKLTEEDYPVPRRREPEVTGRTEGEKGIPLMIPIRPQIGQPIVGDTELLLLYPLISRGLERMRSHTIDRRECSIPG